MSATAKSSISEVHHRPDPPDLPGNGRALYVPTWWERRAPWLLDFLAALDPEPLARGLGRAAAPARWALEGAVDPLAAGLEVVAGRAAAVREAFGKAFGVMAAALPLPGIVRRWLWLRPAEAGPHHPRSEQLTLWLGVAPAEVAIPDAPSRLKRQHSVILPLSLMAAVAAHAALIVLSPTFGITEAPLPSEELHAIELPPDVSLPEPPRPIARPAAPVVAVADIDEDITISPTTFDNYTPDLPAPPPERVVEEAREPTFTPFTVAPRILNADLIEELMAQEYPPLLLEARIGGVVVVWAYINRDGVVEELRVAKSSGYEGLDAAALRVGARIRTSPALNRDVTVPVWIQVPLDFEVH